MQIRKELTVLSQSTSCCSLRFRSLPVAMKLAPSIDPVVLNAQHEPQDPCIDHPNGMNIDTSLKATAKSPMSFVQIMKYYKYRPSNLQSS